MLEWNDLSRGKKLAIIVAAIALVALLGLTIWFMIAYPEVTAVVRDILLIIIALGILALDVLLIILVWQIYKLLVFLTRELAPVVESLQETVGTVRGTATFMSDSMVNPAIGVASKAAGIRRSLDVLFGKGASRPSRRPPTAGSGQPAASNSPASAGPSESEPQSGGNSNGT